MMDFTIETYKKLLSVFQNKGFVFQSFDGFIQHPEKMSIILRHDVDKLPENSLRIARIENKLGIKGTYYFRIARESFNENIIREIASLDHEVGYHYETMVTSRGDIDVAYDKFCENLVTFRKIAPVKTVCMHGSPLSKYDNKEIWTKYDYKKLGLIAEPYFDINFDNVLYLTDTGRCWDGDSVSLRDKINNQNRQSNNKRLFLRVHSTIDIIRAIEAGMLPNSVMMTIHPQRWTDRSIPWLLELIWQNTKNVGKFFLVKIRSRNSE